MLKRLQIDNFTVFPKADFHFGKDLNVIVGENGSGKSHVLKAAYCALAVGAARPRDGGDAPLTKSQLQAALADKLQAVFRPDGLGRLVRRKKGHAKCRLSYVFDIPALNLAYTFSTGAKSEVTVETAPSVRGEKLPVFLPTKELLTIYPNFVSLYDTTHLPFEETWRDTCILLGAPLARGPREGAIRNLLSPIEKAMGGSVELDKSGFYLNLPSGRMEMHLVAEGLRKLAMIARLIATGSLADKGCLFWDEPDANLNPKVIKTFARTILQLASSGLQVFIASHSLFLLRELQILQQQDFEKLDTRCFGLHREGEDSPVEVKQGKTMDDIGDIAALDEELNQSDRYVEAEAELHESGVSQNIHAEAE